MKSVRITARARYALIRSIMRLQASSGNEPDFGVEGTRQILSISATPHTEKDRSSAVFFHFLENNFGLK
jgi:hypothetical protein